MEHIEKWIKRYPLRHVRAYFSKGEWKVYLVERNSFLAEASDPSLGNALGLLNAKAKAKEF